MNFERKLRILAKSHFWQNLFKASQKCAGIRLFQNPCYFSGLQARFLYWLSTYELLFTELATHEDPLLTEKVLEDDIRTDAYLIYRQKKQDFLWKKHREEERKIQLKTNRKKSFKHPGVESVIDVDLRRE
jgi:hypothetical protein